MAEHADSVRVREVADLVAERCRLKKGGEVVRYTRTVIAALQELGYQIVTKDHQQTFAAQIDGSEEA